MALDLFTNQGNIKQVIQRTRTSTVNAWAVFGFTDIEFNEPLQPNQLIRLTVIGEGLNADFQHVLHLQKLLYIYINAESFREGGVRKRSLVFWIGEEVATDVVNSYTQFIPTIEGLIRAREAILVARSIQEIFTKLTDNALLGDSSVLNRAQSVISTPDLEPNLDRARARSVPVPPTVSEPDPRKHRNLKIIIIGNACTGKTSIARFLYNGQIATYPHPPTIGIDMFTVRMTVDNKIVVLDIMDTAGQERYNSLPRSYYRNANGIVLVYSCDERESFEALPEWLNRSRQCSLDCLPVFILLGNKKDTQQRTVPFEDGDNFSKQEGVFFLETSARVNGDNINIAFQTLVRMFNSVDRNIATIAHTRTRAQTQDRGINIDPAPAVNLTESVKPQNSSRCCEE